MQLQGSVTSMMLQLVVCTAKCIYSRNFNCCHQSSALHRINCILQDCETVYKCTATAVASGLLRITAGAIAQSALLLTIISACDVELCFACDSIVAHIACWLCSSMQLHTIDHLYLPTAALLQAVSNPLQYS
jgi:hypothetical protein